MINVDFAPNQVNFWTTIYEKKIIDTTNIALELERKNIELTKVRLDIAKNKENAEEYVIALENAYLNYYEAYRSYTNSNNANAWYLVLIEVINNVPKSNNLFLKALGDLVIQDLKSEQQVLKQMFIVYNKNHEYDKEHLKTIRRRIEDIEDNLENIYKTFRMNLNVEDNLNSINFLELTKLSAVELLNKIYNLDLYISKEDIQKK